MSDSPHTFAGNPLDRAANKRRDPAEIERLSGLPESRFLPLWNLRALVIAEGEPRLAWQPLSDLDAFAGGNSDLVFLGLDGGQPHFAVGVTGENDPAEGGLLSGRGNFEEARPLASQMPAGEAAVLAQARALVDWHARHQFCAVCGSPTTFGEAGYMRACQNEACKAQHFPRTDPVVIMLISLGDRCLLGRNKRFPTRKRYSALAGFVEAGESIEEAVRREVFEESGIVVGNVSYHSSQPWPFPSSLMIGCSGQAESEDINIDPDELQDARWVPRAEVRACFESEDYVSADGGLEIPPPDAIAHHLIKSWVDQDTHPASGGKP